MRKHELAPEQLTMDELVQRSFYLGEQAILVLMAAEGIDRETAGLGSGDEDDDRGRPDFRRLRLYRGLSGRKVDA